jgi:hypothetical protein
MFRFILKKILLGTAVLFLLTFLVGCNVNIFAPRPRMGTLPTPPPGPRFSDPNNLGKHSYSFAPFEKNGIVYTCKAGHIDLTHLRWNADYTRYLTKKTYKTLTKKNKGFSFNVTWEPSTHKIEFIYPENWDDLSKKEKEKIAEEISSEMGPYIAFNATLWHEIITWFGTNFAAIEPEFNSAFSWEDIYSNLLGVKLGSEVVKDPKSSYDKELTLAIDKELKRLGVRSRKAAIDAVEKMRGKWFRGYVDVDTMRKNMDVGLDDGYVTPILVPGVCDGAQPEPLAVPVIDKLSKYGFSMKYEISPKVWEQGKILKAIYRHQKPESKKIQPDKHYPMLMEHIKKEAVGKYGYQVD